MTRRHLIFDMDGTLVDSSAIIANSINHVRSKLGLPPMPKEIILEAVNDTSIHRPKFFYGVQEYQPDHIQWFREYYASNHKNQTRLYEGVKELLQKLRPHHTLALATNAYRQSADLILTHLGIKDYFDTIVCGDEVPRAKPAPDMIKKIMDMHKANKKNTLLIGDGKTDEEAAKTAGIGFLKVNWGWQQDKKNGIDNIEQLETILLQNDK